MQLINGEVLFSPSDLTQAAACEFALLRRLDVKLGRTEDRSIPEDPLVMRAVGLGTSTSKGFWRTTGSASGPGSWRSIGRPRATRPHSRQPCN